MLIGVTMNNQQYSYLPLWDVPGLNRSFVYMNLIANASNGNITNTVLPKMRPRFGPVYGGNKINITGNYLRASSGSQSGLNDLVSLTRDYVRCTFAEVEVDGSYVGPLNSTSMWNTTSNGIKVTHMGPWSTVECIQPPMFVNSSAANVRQILTDALVSVSLNDQNFYPSSLHFNYIDYESILVDSILPSSGPSLGGPNERTRLFLTLIRGP